MSRVQSIERAFAVLGALADGPIGVTEVAERAELPKSTAARLLASLAHEGRRRAGTGRHALPPRPAAGDTRGADPADAVAGGPGPAHRSRRSPETGEAAGLSVADGDLVHYIDQVGSLNPVSVRDWTGSRIPLHAVSSGQVLLAFAPPTFIQRYLGRPMERFTERTLTPRMRAGANASDPSRRLHLGARGVRRGDLVGRSTGRRRVRRGCRGGPPPRAVVPIPGAGAEGPLAEPSSRRRRKSRGACARPDRAGSKGSLARSRG